MGAEAAVDPMGEAAVVASMAAAEGPMGAGATQAHAAGRDTAVPIADLEDLPTLTLAEPGSARPIAAAIAAAITAAPT